jgi:hypothetical protein
MSEYHRNSIVLLELQGFVQTGGLSFDSDFERLKEF